MNPGFEFHFHFRSAIFAPWPTIELANILLVAWRLGAFGGRSWGGGDSGGGDGHRTRTWLLPGSVSCVAMGGGGVRRAFLGQRRVGRMNGAIGSFRARSRPSRS